MLDKSGTVFRIAAVHGSRPGRGRLVDLPNSDEFPLSDAVRTQQPVIVYGPEELIRRYPKLEGTGRSAVLVCLPMGDFGGIALGYDREMEFGDAELEFMTAVVRQCSEAIRRTAFDAERGREPSGSRCWPRPAPRSPGRSTTAPLWGRSRTWPCPPWRTAASSTCSSPRACISSRRCTSSRARSPGRRSRDQLPGRSGRAAQRGRRCAS